MSPAGAFHFVWKSEPPFLMFHEECCMHIRLHGGSRLIGDMTNDFLNVGWHIYHFSVVVLLCDNFPVPNANGPVCDLANE